MSATIDPELVSELAERVAAIEARVERACRRASRSRDEVTVVGACKKQPLARIAAAACAGVTELGENYVQEAQSKHEALTSLLAAHCSEATAPPLRWHMIGHLQSNKARHAVEIFQVIDTVDSAKLANALDRRMEAHGGTLDICLQVNLSGEPQKAGAAEEDLPALLAACAELAHVRVIGLMTMPAAAADPELCRPTFARLRELRDTLSREPGGDSLRELNMGMSGDFEVAVEEGATLIRIGTELYGPREQPPPG